MHVVQHPRRQRVQRRMYSPYERQVINGAGLGEVDGMFNIGKMFTRMFTIRPGSFKLKNIAGAVGSLTTTIATGGIANIASEVAGPSGLKLTKGTITGAHSKPMQYVGYGTMAAAAVAGAYFGGTALLAPAKVGLTTAGTVARTTVGSGSAIIGQATGQAVTLTPSVTGGFLSTVGSGLSTVGSWLGTGVKFLTSALPLLGGVGGGGPQQQQQGGLTQAEYDAQATQAQAQAAYEAQVRAQQQQMFSPGPSYGVPGYTEPIGYTGQPSMQTSYGDLRSPYTAITEDGQQVQVDPTTGQVIQAGIFPELSTTTWLAIGGVTLVGWYFMSGSKSNN